jgi:hypothetical protein
VPVLVVKLYYLTAETQIHARHNASQADISPGSLNRRLRIEAMYFL